ncbi:hypothetical protein TNCV_769121 [Trichonephila clavipes]|nr:hypothetical protein TNCV_769121 [Trichonephila clavipes]
MLVWWSRYPSGYGPECVAGVSRVRVLVLLEIFRVEVASGVTYRDSRGTESLTDTKYVFELGAKNLSLQGALIFSVTPLVKYVELKVHPLTWCGRLESGCQLKCRPL